MKNLNTPEKRPNDLALMLVGGLIGIPIGGILIALTPENMEDAQGFVGLIGVASPPVGLLMYSRKKWTEYEQSMLKLYEAKKEQLRKHPENIAAREAMLKAGRVYYSCLREDGVPTIYDEQAINNDMAAIIGA